MAKKTAKRRIAHAPLMTMEPSRSQLLLRNLPALSRSMTFPKMVRPNLKLIPNFRELTAGEQELLFGSAMRQSPNIRHVDCYAHTLTGQSLDGRRLS
jgi:hypothetical protein